MSTTTTTTTNVEICTRAQTELFGAGRLELADELVTPDCIDHGPEVGPHEGHGPAIGRDGVRSSVQWLRGAFPDLAYEIHDAFGDADRVALRTTARGTHSGEFLGRPGSGRSFEVQQVHVFRLENGQIAEHWAGRDDVRMMFQLGLFG